MDEELAPIVPMYGTMLLYTRACYVLYLCTGDVRYVYMYVSIMRARMPFL